MLTAGGKAQARPGDQIDDDARDEYLARRSRCCHTCGDVDRDAADVVVTQLDLARVYARPHLEAQAPQHVADRHGTPDRAGGSVEPGEEAVARRVDLTAVEALELAPDLGVVPAEQLLPSFVAELDRSLGGVDDVGKQHGGQNALYRRHRTNTGEELLDLVEHAVGVAREEQVVGAIELDELGPGDAIGEVATHLEPQHPVVPPVEHKRRDLDRGQHIADVQLRIEREDVADHARAGGHAL